MRRLAWLWLLGAVGCGAAPAPAPPTERGPAPDPWVGLPPLSEPHPPATRIPPLGRPPRQVDRVLAPLGVTSARAPRPVPVRVVPHPPLDGNPFGAVAFVFNQPMVDPLQPPTVAPDAVRTTPPQPGRLAWLGDRTLVFTPKPRFRYATPYRVSVRLALRARSGAPFKETVATGFTTQAPRLVDSHPALDALVPTTPRITLRFNQPVSREAVAHRARLTRLGAPGAPVRLSALNAGAARIVRLVPVTPLLPSSRYRLTLPAGLPAQEGPLRSTEPVDQTLHTSGRLRLVGVRCGRGPCLPSSTVALLVEGRRPTARTCRRLRATPPLPHLRCRPQGRALLLTAPFHSGAHHRLTLAPDAERDGPVDGVAASGIALVIGHPPRPLAFTPNRPLLVTGPGLTIRYLPGPLGGRLRAAPVPPALALTVLQAIAAPDAAAPFHLLDTRAPPRPLPQATPGESRARLRLDRLLGARAGQLWLLSLDGPAAPSDDRRRTALVQVTALRLAVRYGWDNGAILVTQARDSAAVPRAQVELRGPHGRVRWKGTTDVHGRVQFPGERRLRGAGPYALWVKTPKDRAFVVLDGGGEDGHRVPGYLRGGPRPSLERLVGAVLTDRSTYVPGQYVRLFGALRAQTRLPRGSVGHLPSRAQDVAFRVVTDDDEEVATGRLRLGTAGLFAGGFQLPRRSRPGRYTVWLNLRGVRHRLDDWVIGTFRVQRSSAGLDLRIETRGQASLGTPLTFALQLRDRRGHPMHGAILRWRLYRHADAPAPPGYDGFLFGTAPEPLATGADAEPALADDPIWIADGEGRSDGQGQLTVRAPLEAPPYQRRAAFELSVEATTLDGRHQLARHRVVANRDAVQLGLRASRRMVEVNARLAVRVVAVDARGRPSSGLRVRVEAEPLEPGARPAEAPCTRTLFTGTAACVLRLPGPGRWAIRATAPGAAAAEILAYAHGVHPAAGPREPLVELLPDRERYDEADEARVLIRAPVSAGHVLLTLERDGVAWSGVADLHDGQAVATVPLGPGLAPNAWLSAMVLPPDGASAPGSALTARVQLAVRAHDRRLRVTTTVPPGPQPPRHPLPVRVHVTAPDGRDVPAGLLIYLTPDGPDPPRAAPWQALRPERAPGVALRSTLHHSTRFPSPAAATTLLPDPPPLGASGRDSATQRAHRDLPPQPSGPAVTLPFRGPFPTDADGRLALTLPLPHRPGRYRLVVLAADQNLPARFGHATRAVEVQPPLAIRTNLPSTLRVGDRVTLRVRVQNHTALGGLVVVRARSAGATVHPLLRQLPIAPRRRAAALFSLRAEHAGVARLQLAALLGPHHRNLEQRTTVVAASDPTGTADRLGEFTGTVRIPLRWHRLPAGRPTEHQLSLTVAAEPWGACQPLLHRWILQEHPSLGVTALRLLSLALLARKPGAASGSDWLDAPSRRMLARRAIRQLLALRLPGGGFRRHAGSPPAVTPAVGLALLALERARRAGYPVPAAVLDAGAAALARAANQAVVEPRIRIQALQVLRALGRFVRPATVDALLSRWPRLSRLDRARLIPVVIALRPNRGKALLQATLRQRATSRRPDPERLAQELLGALAARRPATELTRRSRTLLRAFRNPYWRSPWTATWVLLALRAAAHHRAPGPAAPLTAWVGVRRLESRPLRPGADRLHYALPLQRRAPPSVTLSTGRAPLYYFLSLREPAAGAVLPGVDLVARYRPLAAAPGPRPGTPLRLPVGGLATGRITLVSTRTLPETVLRVEIPAGARVVDPGAQEWPGPERSASGFPRLPVLDAVVRGSALWLHLEGLEPGIHEHRLTIQATTRGRYRCGPATLLRAADGAALTRSAGCQSLEVTRPAPVLTPRRGVGSAPARDR